MYPLRLLLILLLAASRPTYAIEMKEGVNYCHDPEAVDNNKKLLAKYSKDIVLIRLLALRDGLCGMIDRGQITLDRGIDIYTDEQNKSAIQRSNEELTEERRLTL